MSMRVCLRRYPVAKIRSGMPASLPPGRSNFCICPRHMSTQVSLRPVPVTGLCGPGVTCFPVGLTSGPAYRCSRPQAPGGIWPDGNTGGIDNYPVCLRHSGQQSHTYYCLLLSVSWFRRCPCHRTTCVMTVSVSTLLAGRCGRNCLYLNCLGNKSLAKRPFRKGVLADSCRGFNLAMCSISVTYCKSVTNHACQEGRKSVLSFIGFRKSICACPCIIAPLVRSRPQALDGTSPY